MGKVEKFIDKYGVKEVELKPSIITIKDYSNSGSCGRLSKVRVRDNKFEFYHDWWAYGWLGIEEIEREYPCAACQLDDAINYLL